MENHESPELIEQQMQETRNSLTEKVAMLEGQVMDTVQTATSAMQTTVETVKDTVDNVKTAMEDTMSSVKNTVRETFDVSSHVQERPWAMIGGAVAAGFVTGFLASGGRKSEPRERDFRPLAPQPEPVRAVRSEPNWFDKLLERAGDELRKLGESAIDQVVQSVQQSVHQGVPRLMEDLQARVGLGPDGLNRTASQGTPHGN